MIEQKEVIKMDMYQKRKIRAEKKNNDSQKSFSKVPISWYPGHIAKTKRLMKENLNKIDVVYEVIDARIPYSSKIQDIDTIIQNNPSCDLFSFTSFMISLVAAVILFTMLS